MNPLPGIYIAVAQPQLNKKSRPVQAAFSSIKTFKLSSVTTSKYAQQHQEKVNKIKIQG
jgi:hypothetical protein